jgi:hypothetical protein
MIRTVTRTLALAAVIGAAGAAPASAMLPLADPPASSDASTQPVIVKEVQPGGFDFGDAAIGAGVAFTIVLAGSGGRLALHRARQPQVSPGA